MHSDCSAVHFPPRTETCRNDCGQKSPNTTVPSLIGLNYRIGDRANELHGSKDQSSDKRVYLCSLFIDFEASKDLLHLLNGGRGLTVWCLVTLGRASYPTISHTSAAMWTVNAMAAKLSLPPMTTIAEEELCFDGCRGETQR